MNFKVGDKVRLRNGDILSVKNVQSPNETYPVILSDNTCYTSTGQFFTNNHDSKFDIVANLSENTGAQNQVQEIKPTSDKRLKTMYAYTKLPRALCLLAKVCQWGDSKHGPGKIKLDVDYKAKQQAHFTRLLSGETHDKESGIDHRVAIAFNMLAEIEKEMEEGNVSLESIIMGGIK